MDGSIFFMIVAGVIVLMFAIGVIIDKNIRKK